MKTMLTAAAGLALLAACASKPGPAGPSTNGHGSVQGTAEFKDEKGVKIGSALLTAASGGVSIVIEFQKLPPGEHALHIHNVGQCHAGEGGAKAFASAGPHFNPFGKKHGKQNPEGPHAGDLPNFTVGADGTAHVEVLADLVTLEDDKPNSLFKAGGTCLVVHEKADDYATDPTGNAGARLACGEIERKR